MTKLITDICHQLYSIKLTFSGSFDIDVPVIRGKEEFYDLDIPTPQQDRKNLKNDREVVISDFKKALKEKSHQLTD